MTPRPNDDGTTTNLVICHDLTERRKQESALRTSQLEFRLLAMTMPGYTVEDLRSERVLQNRVWTRIEGNPATTASAVG